MPKFLKGNYRLPDRKRASVAPRAKTKKDLTQQFEEAALAKLGGSICFVTKRSAFLWTGAPTDQPGAGTR